jgi:hypothetical protein
LRNFLRGRRPPTRGDPLQSVDSRAPRIDLTVPRLADRSAPRTRSVGALRDLVDVRDGVAQSRNDIYGSTTCDPVRSIDLSVQIRHSN